MRILQFIIITLASLTIISCTETKKEKNIYDFEVTTQDNRQIPLKEYKGKIILIVNTASKCGFTPQYAELETLYKKYADKDFEILDFPCNQFGGQSPESDEETTAFCQLNYGTTFAQLKEIEVNGDNESPLYSWLKSQKGFTGLDKEHPNYAKLENRLKNQNPDYASTPDIKWNFTKFLIDRDGNVVARYEPTADIKKIEKKIEELL